MWYVFFTRCCQLIVYLNHTICKHVSWASVVGSESKEIPDHLQENLSWYFWLCFFFLLKLYFWLCFNSKIYKFRTLFSWSKVRAVFQLPMNRRFTMDVSRGFNVVLSKKYRHDSILLIRKKQQFKRKKIWITIFLFLFFFDQR